MDDNGDFLPLFKFGPCLGRGGFGSVHKVVKLSDRKMYALKIINVSKGSPGYEDAVKEAQVMMALVHPNILRIFGIHESIPKPGGSVRAGILVECCEGGDLHNYIIGRICRKISPKKMKMWMMQLSSGLAYIHEKAIIHRDIKPQNIFMGRRNNLKIGDFGVSKEMLASLAFTFVGTPAFMSPEAQYGTYGLESDVYSLGCVFLCMATLNIFPKNQKGEVHQLPSPSVYGLTINAAILSCMDRDKDLRPKAQNVLRMVASVDLSVLDREEDATQMDFVLQPAEPESLHFRVLQGNDNKRQDGAGVKLRARKSKVDIRFHCVHGRNITLDEEGRLALRETSSELNAVLFSSVPVGANTVFSLEISETLGDTLSLLTFGFTSVNPATLSSSLPGSADAVPDSWTAVRYDRLQCGSKFSFHFDKQGNMFSTCHGATRYRQENQVVRPGVPLWATVSFVFPIVAVKIAKNCGTSIAKSEANIPNRPYSMNVPPDVKMTDYLNKPQNEPEGVDETLKERLGKLPVNNSPNRPYSRNVPLDLKMAVYPNQPQNEPEDVDAILKEMFGKLPVNKIFLPGKDETLKPEPASGAEANPTPSPELLDETSKLVESVSAKLNIWTEKSVINTERTLISEEEDLPAPPVDSPTFLSEEIDNFEMISTAPNVFTETPPKITENVGSFSPIPEETETGLSPTAEETPTWAPTERRQFRLSAFQPDLTQTRDTYHRDSPSLAHVSVASRMKRFQGKD